MKKIKIIKMVAVLALLGLTVAMVNAAVMPGRNGIKGPVHQTDARPALAQRVHDVGNIWMAISNYGNYGDPNASLPSAEWPSGSEVYYIWEGRFWLGAMVGGEPLVSHADYGNYEFDPTEGSVFYFGTGPKSIQDGVVQFDDLTDIEGHTPIGFEISQRSLSWSLPEYDDFVVFLYEIKNVSGGTLNGVYPSWVFDNDVGAGPGGDPDQPHIDDLVDYDGWTPDSQNPYKVDWVDPYDLDGDGETGYDYWGWAKADPRNPYQQGYKDDGHMPETFEAEPDGIYDEYQLYFDPNGPEVIGQEGTVFEGQVLTDADGEPLHGYLLSRNMSYMYDGDYAQSGENDTGERSLSTPVAGFIGTRILYMPIEPFNLSAADSMARPYSHQWWNWESDPGSDKEKYEYMTGNHSLSQGMKFMPHPFDYGAGAPVFDYRYMHTIGPINDWQDGETRKFVMVTGVGWGLQGVREIIDNALVAYYQGEPEVIGTPVLEAPDPEQRGFTGVSDNAIRQDKHFLLPIPPPIPDLHYSPGDRQVRLVWDSYAETAIDNFLGTSDFEGYKIYRSKYNAQTWELIAAFDVLDTEVYLLNTEGDTLNPILPNGSTTVTVDNISYTFDIGDTVTITHPAYETMRMEGGGSFLKVNLPGTSEMDIVHSYIDDGGDFLAQDGTLIIRNTEAPVNGLKYYYAVAAYDPDKPQFGLFQIESAKSNYRKSLEGAPEAVIPRPDPSIDEDLLVQDVDPEELYGTVDNVTVVPNPYKATAVWESRYEDRIAFFNLPPRAKISIFTMTGDLVDEIYHNDATQGSADWDLISRNNQKVVSGLYIYIVETPDEQKKVGKFLIMR